MSICLHGVHGGSGSTTAELIVETGAWHEAENICYLACYRKVCFPLLCVTVFRVLVYSCMYLVTVSTHDFVKEILRNHQIGQWRGITRQSSALFLEAGGNSGDFRMQKKDLMAWEREGAPQQREYKIKSRAKPSRVSTACLAEKSTQFPSILLPPREGFNIPKAFWRYLLFSVH